jgi:hypothetical protein
MKRHKHSDLIVAWANGAKIEVYDDITHKWYDVDEMFMWNEKYEYRVKNECFVRYCQVKIWNDGCAYVGPAGPEQDALDNVKLTFDHQCNLINVEIIK